MTRQDMPYRAHELSPGHPQYPARLAAYHSDGNEIITAIGDPAIMRSPLLALFCSARCPGRLILRTYDLAVALRDAGVAVVSGFHTPMEKECLALLLRGTQPVVVCPARSIAGMRIPPAYSGPLAAGRLLLLSPFAESERRITAETAERRNRLVAALARTALVAHAAPGSRTEALCREIASSGARLLTLDDPANAPLAALGAILIQPHDIAALSARERLY
jgi:predicted Rossmann fold nucleotide-binding protein DprA/Smf involved in DNA uptake